MPNLFVIVNDEDLYKDLKKLHGPSIFAVKAKIYGGLFNQSISTAFGETSIYWSAPKSS